MFHVEPGQFHLHPHQPGRIVGPGNEHLRLRGQQAFQHPSLMAAVQLRSQIVQRDHRPFAAHRRVMLGLGEQGR